MIVYVFIQPIGTCHWHVPSVRYSASAGLKISMLEDQIPNQESTSSWTIFELRSSNTWHNALNIGFLFLPHHDNSRTISFVVFLRHRYRQNFSGIIWSSTKNRMTILNRFVHYLNFFSFYFNKFIILFF